MDPFEDLFAPNPAPARSKFLPKGPKKGPPVVKPSATSLHSSSKAPPTREEVTHVEEPGNVDTRISKAVPTNERPCDDGGWPPGLTRSAQENADRLSHPESVDDLLTASVNKEGNETFPSPSNNVVEMDTNAGSYMNGEDGVGEDGDQSTFEKKKATRKPRESKSKDVKKPSRKKKGAEQVSEQEPKKKFSHTSRRSRRVDKALLETPEEEIDHQSLIFRDLIRLAEHYERSAKKSRKQSTKPSNGQSVGNAPDADDGCNKEGSLPYEDGNSSAQPSESVEPSVTLYNYQSFMEKTPRTRWSKQATEFFYEGIRQFGTDLSMIKELFPGLTRDQMKRKFKKEERQNRWRLFDAWSSPAKDHKQFEFVLEQLQAAEAEKESELGNAEAVTWDDAEDSSPETNDHIFGLGSKAAAGSGSTKRLDMEEC